MKFKENWDFFLRNLDKMTFCGTGDILTPEFDKNGLSPEDCFYKYDSTGELDKCSDPELFRKVMIFKKSLNFHIKMWVEGYEDMLIGIDEYLEILDDPPEWVRESFRNQLYKKMEMKK